MKINQILVESAGATVAFAFGRFNPAHQGHIEVWSAVEQAGANWFIGTNPNTIGPDDPLTFEQKSAWMEEIYPPISGHIVAQTSVLTLAAYIFKKLRKNERATVAYITDATDWAWSGKLLNQYNGKEGAHGYYKFAEITHVPSPRVTSASELRKAARANDRVAFYDASGTDPKSTVDGLTYFDTVKQAVEKYPLPVKRGQKVKEQGVAEGPALSTSTLTGEIPTLMGLRKKEQGDLIEKYALWSKEKDYFELFVELSGKPMSEIYNMNDSHQLAYELYNLGSQIASDWHNISNPKFSRREYLNQIMSNWYNLFKKSIQKYKSMKQSVAEDDEQGEVKKQGQLIPWPAGTTKVHVSDVYDWYKLGMVISDLDDADPKMFGQGAPQTIIAFGSEEEESKLLPLLKRLGLKVDDIDPEGTDLDEAYHAGAVYEYLKKATNQGIAENQGDSLKFNALEKLIAIKQQIQQEIQQKQEADIAAWKQDFEKNTVQKAKQQLSTTLQTTPVAQAGEKYNVLKDRLVQLNVAIQKHKELNNLIDKIKKEYPVVADRVDSYYDSILQYAKAGAKDNYKSLIAKLNSIDKDLRSSYPGAVKDKQGVAEANINQQVSLWHPETKTYRGSRNNIPTSDYAGDDDITKNYRKVNKFKHSEILPNLNYNVSLGGNDDSIEKVEQNINREKIKNLISDQLHLLNPREKEVFYHKFWHDMNTADIAQQMSLSTEMVKRTADSALRKLRRSPDVRKLIPYFDAMVAEGSLTEMASKLLSAEDRNGVITVVVQAPDGTRRSLADENPRYINQWLETKYGLTLPRSIMARFVESKLAEFAPSDDSHGDEKSYLLQLADDLFQAIYVARNKMAVKAVKEKIAATGGNVKIVWNNNGSFNVVMYHPVHFKQGHLVSLVGDSDSQRMGESTNVQGPVEAWGYRYNERDQRVMWRLNFDSEQAAHKWADSKNATVVEVRPIKQLAEEEQKTVAKTWDQMTPQEKSSGVKGRTLWNEKTQRYYTVFDVPVNDKAVDEGWLKNTAASLALGAAAMGGAQASSATIDDPSWHSGKYPSHVKSDHTIQKQTGSSSTHQKRISDVTGPNAAGEYKVTVTQNGKIASQYITKTPPPDWMVKAVDEDASLATMRNFFAGDKSPHDPNAKDKRFRSPAEYEAWLKQNKLKQISGVSEDEEVDEANLSVMRDFFAKDNDDQDSKDIQTTDKRFRSPEEYEAWLAQNKLKKVAGPAVPTNDRIHQLQGPQTKK